MPRRFILAQLALIFTVLSTPLFAAQGQLVPETVAARGGLTRPWFAQVEMDQQRAKVTDLMLFEGAIYAQTNTAVIHALDAETGKTLWSKRIGRPEHPSMPLEVKGNLLAMINGSRLYVLNRLNGELLYEKEVQDAPGAGPGLSTKHAFVPIVTGMLIAHRVEEVTDRTKKKQARDGTPTAGGSAAATADAKKIRVNQQEEPPLFCQAFGRALVAPLVTREFAGGEYVVWPTDRGCLNFGRIDQEAGGSLVLKYRLETRAPIVCRPAYLPPDPQVLGEAGIVFAGTSDGFVYAIQEESGNTLWQFPTGEAISRAPAVIDDRVFVATDFGGMYCLDGKSGKNLWWAENIKQFVAASKNRVYAVDRIDRLAVLDRATGARLDTLPLEGVGMKLSNSDTDRIYLVSPSGLVQCLREMVQTEPLQHGKDRKDAMKAEASRSVEPEPEQPKKVVEKADKPERKAASTPKEPAPPKERPAKKEPKKGKKGGDADNPFMDQGADPFGGNGGGKPPKAGKGKKNPAGS